MKKIYRYLFAAVAIASVASCAEQIEDNSTLGTQNTPADFAQMTISASLGEVTKTTYKDQSVLWEGTESITVFSKGSEDTPTEFAMNWCSEDNTKASFTGLANLNAESYYAVYPHSATNACTAEGVLTVEIPAQQTAVAGGFASGANVSVAAWQNVEMSSENDIIFNNVCSLLSFGFETDADAVLTESVTVKVKKSATEYFGIAGNVSVNYNPEGTLVVSEGKADSIVLNAPEGGFAKGVTYYVLVAPVGQIAEMELTYTHTDGTTTCTRKNSNIIASLSRSTLVPLDIIPVAYDDLSQDDFEVVFDFTGDWPFTPKCKEVSEQQSKVADTYSYNYIYDHNGISTVKNLETGLYWGGYSQDRGYLMQEGGLLFDVTDGKTNGGSLIKCPSFTNRYLKEVRVLQKDNATKSLYLHSGFPGSQVKTSFTKVSRDNDTECVFTLPCTYNNVVYGKQLGETFSVRMRTADVIIARITMVYSKTKPE